MANTKSAGKRARQTAGRTLRNRSTLSRLRRMHKGLSSGEGAKDPKKVSDLISAVDKAAKRGVLHRNAARRRKARLLKAARASA